MGISKWNKKEDHEEGITLSDVIRGLQFCVNSSAEIMEQHHLATMDKYIDPKTQAPLTKRFVIRDGYAIDVPLICLSDHHTLYLDEMDVKLSVRLKDINIKETTAPLNGDGSKFSIDRGSFLVELAGAVPDEDAAVDVNLKFKSTPPPEALARIVEKLDNAITPFEIKGGRSSRKAGEKLNWS